MGTTYRVASRRPLAGRATVCFAQSISQASQRYPLGRAHNALVRLASLGSPLVDVGPNARALAEILCGLPTKRADQGFPSTRLVSTLPFRRYLTQDPKGHAFGVSFLRDTPESCKSGRIWSRALCLQPFNKGLCDGVLTLGSPNRAPPKWCCVAQRPGLLPTGKLVALAHKACQRRNAALCRRPVA